MKKKSLIIKSLAFSLMMMTAACASKKNVVTEMPLPTGTSSGNVTPPTATQPTPAKPVDQPLASTTDFLKKVLDNRVTAKNIVSDMTFNIKIGSKDITVPVSLRMRRDSNFSFRYSARRSDVLNFRPIACSSSTACTRNTSRPITRNSTSSKTTI